MQCFLLFHLTFVPGKPPISQIYLCCARVCRNRLRSVFVQQLRRCVQNNAIFIDYKHVENGALRAKTSHLAFGIFLPSTPQLHIQFPQSPIFCIIFKNDALLSCEYFFLLMLISLLFPKKLGLINFVRLSFTIKGAVTDLYLANNGT